MSDTLDQFAADEARWLEALQREWADFYLVSVDNGRWHAHHADRTGSVITAASASGLRQALQARHESAR